MNIRKKLSPKDNKIVKDVTYKTTVGLLKTVTKMANHEGISDINDVLSWIESLSVDEFCDYKFADVPELEQGGASDVS